MQKDGERDEWHLDKRIPIGIIFTILAQTVFVAWALSEARSDIDFNRERIASQEARLTSHEIQLRELREMNGQQAVVLGQIEVQLRNIGATLNKLEQSFGNGNGNGNRP